MSRLCPSLPLSGQASLKLGESTIYLRLGPNNRNSFTCKARASVNHLLLPLLEQIPILLSAIKLGNNGFAPRLPHSVTFLGPENILLGQGGQRVPEEALIRQSPHHWDGGCHR